MAFKMVRVELRLLNVPSEMIQEKMAMYYHQ